MLRVKRQQRPSGNARGALQNAPGKLLSMAQARFGAISQFSHGATLASNTILVWGASEFGRFTSSSRDSRSICMGDSNL
jgi:hypothetical protein